MCIGLRVHVGVDRLREWFAVGLGVRQIRYVIPICIVLGLDW